MGAQGELSPTTSTTSDLTLTDTLSDKLYPSVTGAPYQSKGHFADSYGGNHEDQMMAEESTCLSTAGSSALSRRPLPAWPCSATAPAARRSPPPCRSKADTNRSGRSERAGKCSRHDGYYSDAKPAARALAELCEK